MIYVSVKTDSFDPIDKERGLQSILDVARERNGKDDVSGMLFYHAGLFFQLLEGPKEPVLKLYNKISEDDRHTDCKIILEQETDERAFPFWSMGYVNTSGKEVESVESILPIQVLISAAKEGSTVPKEKILKFVQHLKKALKE